MLFSQTDHYCPAHKQPRFSGLYLEDEQNKLNITLSGRERQMGKWEMDWLEKLRARRAP